MLSPNVVLEHGVGLAEQVRNGALRLDAAYDEVCRRKAQAAAITAQYDNPRSSSAWSVIWWRW
ncbi:hypothetical protein ACGFZK_17555 [Streptomyces sp. NPDC048257]|uniref:hypothetical protein n=1 Tax=Streptomyces sp. NPDC048257 TaxID=3365526 RepID=UPI0037100CC0